jgi:hypothetical protein
MMFVHVHVISDGTAFGHAIPEENFPENEQGLAPKK